MKYIYHSIFFVLILLLIFSCSNSRRLSNYNTDNQHVNYSFQTEDHKSDNHFFTDVTASTSDVSSNENSNHYLIQLSSNIQKKLNEPIQQKVFSQKEISKLVNKIIPEDSSLNKKSEIPVNAPRKTHWASVASLVTGFLAAITFTAFLILPFTITVSTVLFWLGLGCIFGILALAFGVTGAKASGKNKKFKNKGLAIAGYVMGIAGMVLIILASLISIGSLF